MGKEWRGPQRQERGVKDGGKRHDDDNNDDDDDDNDDNARSEDVNVTITICR